VVVSHREAERRIRTLQRVAGLQWVVGAIVRRRVVPAADLSLRLAKRLLHFVQRASDVVPPGHLFEQLASRGLLVGPPATQGKAVSQSKAASAGSSPVIVNAEQQQI